MSEMQAEEGGTLTLTRKILILLLLVVLVLVLVYYDQGAAEDYANRAYTQGATITQKATHWAKRLYSSSAAECDSEAAAPSNSVVPAGQAESQQQQESRPWAPDTASAMEPGAASAQTGNPSLPPPHFETQAPSVADQPPALQPYPSGETSSAGSALSPHERTSPLVPRNDTPAEVTPPATKPSEWRTPSTPSIPGKVDGSFAPLAHAPLPHRPDEPSSWSAPPTQNTMPALSPPPLPAPDPVRPDRSTEQRIPEATGGLVPARIAAMEGRYGEAVSAYRRYLSIHPNDMNAFGELGNVYMAIGKFPEAAQNYYEAATRLIDAGRPQQLVPLMPVIRRYEPMLAALLDRKASRAVENENGRQR